MTINVKKSYIQFSQNFWFNFHMTTSWKYQENQTQELTSKSQGSCIVCILATFPHLSLFWPHGAYLFWQLMDFLLNWLNSLTQLSTTLTDADRWQPNGLTKRMYEPWVCKVSCRIVQSTGHSPLPLWTRAKLLHCLNTSDIFTVTHGTWFGCNTATSQVANFSISLLMLVSVFHI